MRRLYALALIALLLCMPRAHAQVEDKSAIIKKIPSAAQMLNNSAQGREFWLAVPPNEFDGAYPTEGLEFYITSSRDTKVTLEHPGSGFRMTKPVKAYTITTFSTEDESANWSWEIREDERTSNQGIRIFADQPISVYVLNAKSVSADGYLGLPTSVWGTQYMHMSLYDFGEFANWPWGAGFVIIAKEDQTKVQFKLKGTDNGNAAGRTKRGKRLGDAYTVTLRRGQTYMVRGNGLTLNEFDFSGTIITASKPIGFLSFHQRTMIPSFPSPNNGRDHIVEMIPPMSAWGKRYVTLELQSGANRGDFFRVFAKEDNTRFKCRYTDLKDGKTYTWEGTLKKAGDFMERENTWPPSTSIKGVAVWTADKPIFVMQYACSSQWYDGDPIFDPAMVIGVPVEQYTYETVFQTPSNVEFINNYFNILAIGDTTDITQAKLKTITIDGQPVWIKQPTFIVNRIQDTDIYWAKVKLPPGPHHIKGETRFGGIIYGFSNFASYLWPAATAMNKIDELDTLKPLLDTLPECGDYKVTATEKRNQAPNAAGDSTQIDSGVNQVDLDPVLSYNYKLEYDIAIDDMGEDRSVYTFRLKVIDKSQDAFAVYYVTDRAGNTAIDSVRYTAELVAMKPDSVIFGKVRVKTGKILTAKLVNPTKRDVEVKNISLKYNSNFKILKPTSFPLVVLSGTETDIEFEYTPTEEMKNADDFDLDSVYAEASCGKFVLGWLQGQGVMPRIKVADWNAKTHQVGDEYCNTNEDGSLLIENIGTDVLTITDITGVAVPFSLDPTKLTPALPIVIQPGASVVLKTLCFKPEKTGEHKIDVTFVSDVDMEDQRNDNVSEWKGVGVTPGPVITDWPFNERRVKTRHTGEIALSNTGTFTLNVTGFRTTGDMSSLKVLSVEFDDGNNNRTAIPLKAPVGDWTEFVTTMPLYAGKSKIVFAIEFIPQNEEAYAQRIIPTYGNYDGTEVSGLADGVGILPHINVQGHVFTCIERGTTSNEVGTVTITNTSTTASLVVKSVTLSNAPSAFELRAKPGDVLPSPTELLTIPANGGKHEIDVYFTADNTVGSFTAPDQYLDNVIVVADTKPGDGVHSDGDFFEPAQAQIQGCDYTTGRPNIEVSDFTFDNLLLCDSQTATFTVKNTGERDLVVSDFLYSGNTAVYTITDDQGNVLPKPVVFTLAPNAVKTFRITFTPQNGAAPYGMTVEVVSNAVTATDEKAIFNGSGYPVPVTFTVIGSTKKLLPKDNTELQISLSGNAAQAKLNEFVLELGYDAEALRYTGRFDAPGLNGWTIDIQPDKDINGNNAHGKITIRGRQNTGNPLATEGVFLELEMSVYLSSKDELPLVLSAPRAGLGSRAVCVEPSTVNGTLFLDELCVRDFRGVRYKQPFGITQNAPNPSNGETEIEYTVAFEVPVKLVVYNAMGEEVKVLVDGTREAGTYRVRVNTNELPSGAYTYRITAGPFVETRQMVISK